MEYAKKKGRKKPRDDRYGLPNLEVHVNLRLEVEEHEIYSKGISKALRELGESWVLWLSDAPFAGHTTAPDWKP